ncbi:HAMP domain-containing sensor histidine kinase [Pseudodesulfovibrio sp.]|uniref:sensor histidine kinase n=1 Tax=Pseudodesulfovibrio sp. TaxID=2035812 RepID=UPI002628E643|nr:HAMP domain-containing sensor histidine kinase [Pseudodesulfovibrio sp.]MDD3310796.1 HAMP domain-containing sensor histidine kinase [Pseudodesulfovibrio sp.]
MPRPLRLSIAAKLLLWSGALILIFFAATAFLFRQVRHDAEVANRLVTVHHKVDSAIQRMLDRLYSIRDNVLRYRLTGNKDAVQFIVADLNRFGEILRETMAAYPQYAEEWSDLTREFAITLAPGDSAGDSLAPDATIQDWTGILEQSLMDNQSDMQVALTGLHAAGQRAAEMGLYGLALCLFLGVGGSLALAWSINRSLAEVRRGLAAMGGGGTPRDVRVLADDELGELALAFNDMAGRLRREEAMRADFIAMLSHEIRTPLTSVREGVDLVRSGAFGEVNERQRHFLGIAEKESVRLTDLLARLMTVSRLESQAVALSPGPVDCAELLGSALDRLAASADKAGVTLSADPPGEPVTCVCDREHVRQALLNLIGNAVKFSPAGRPVEAGVRREGGEAVFRVRDHGPGIAAGELERIFEKYYRADEVRDSVDGAGLGLAIARRIAEAHGGRIRVESEPGQGALFELFLPLAGPKETA